MGPLGKARLRLHMPQTPTPKANPQSVPDFSNYRWVGGAHRDTSCCLSTLNGRVNLGIKGFDRKTRVPSYVSIEGLALKDAKGRQAPLRLQPVMKSDDTTLTLHAVRAGIGMAFLPDWLIDDDLAAGRLVRLVPDYAAPPVTLFAVYTSRQYMAPKLRSFIDFLGERLRV